MSYITFNGVSAEYSWMLFGSSVFFYQQLLRRYYENNRISYALFSPL